MSGSIDLLNPGLPQYLGYFQHPSLSYLMKNVITHTCDFFTDFWFIELDFDVFLHSVLCFLSTRHRLACFDSRDGFT